jgi:hypothetical protein
MRRRLRKSRAEKKPRAARAENFATWLDEDVAHALACAIFCLAQIKTAQAEAFDT